MVKYLVTPPSDLSALARRNGGVFPRERLVAAIDGPLSTEVGPPGSREMPIWGRQFRAEAERDDTIAAQADGRAQRRIDVLVNCLASLQQP